MEWWQAVVLAVIQGLTEFLPISSSGHLVLVPRLFGWSDQGVAFDVALHVGTLLAVVLYFRRDLLPLVRGFFGLVAGRRDDVYGKLAAMLLLATIPVGVTGLTGSSKRGCAAPTSLPSSSRCSASCCTPRIGSAVAAATSARLDSQRPC
jgi:undecaprenyl pyrophosphate phosphatase UppP